MPYLPIAAITAGLLALAANQASAAQPSQPDKTFAAKAAQGGLAEVEVGQMAQQKAALPEVKQFGETLVTDHTQANQELQQIAQSEGIALPTQPSSNQQAESRKLQKLSGKKFDRTFVKDEIKDHRKDIAEFQNEAQSGTDPALKAFAQKTLPVLQKHLQMAQELSKQE